MNRQDSRYQEQKQEEPGKKNLSSLQQAFGQRTRVHEGISQRQSWRSGKEGCVYASEKQRSGRRLKPSWVSSATLRCRCTLQCSLAKEGSYASQLA